MCNEKHNGRKISNKKRGENKKRETRTRYEKIDKKTGKSDERVKTNSFCKITKSYKQ